MDETFLWVFTAICALLALLFAGVQANQSKIKHEFWALFWIVVFVALIVRL